MITTARKTTILVVEDEPQLRRTVLRALDREGFEVVLAERAEDALARIELGQSIDLIICDLNLPSMTGLDLYQRLREVGFDGRFMLTSGLSREDIEHQGTMPPGLAFLQKPWTLEDLSRGVRAVLYDA
jgi:DNA-binding response OmpR family regulator